MTTSPPSPSSSFSSYKKSIAVKLLRVVFSFYVVIALSITLFHMLAEYNNTKDQIFHELESMKEIFGSTISTATWELDSEQLQVISKGMVRFPSIIGIAIWSEGEKLIATEGITDQGEKQENGIFSYEFPLFFINEENPEKIGRVTIYSSNHVIFEKVKVGFFFLIVNSVVKTLALWVIFLLASRFVLSRPLRILTKATEQLNLETLEQFKIDIRITDRNEFKILEEAFNTMIQKLIFSREELKEKKRLHMELQTARTVQELLLPKADPQLNEIEISSHYQSATEAGGDWYYYRHHSKLNLMEVLVGDVTGHGVPAAIITGMVDAVYQAMHEKQIKNKNIIRDEVATTYPNSFLELVNNVLHSTTQGEYQMTMMYSVIDFEKKILIYSCAAHNPILVYRPSQFSFLSHGREKTSLFRSLSGKASYTLGHARGSVYTGQIQELQKGDVILWFTDGLIENKNVQDEMFGMRRLKALLKKLGERDAESIKASIVSAILDHRGQTDFEDDVTLVVGKMR